MFCYSNVFAIEICSNQIIIWNKFDFVIWIKNLVSQSTKSSIQNERSLLDLSLI